MDDTIQSRRRLASARYARATGLYGASDPRTIAAGREFGAAKAAEVIAMARGYGLDDTDLIAVVRTGQLPREVAA
jgi:hypothetical protein